MTATDALLLLFGVTDTLLLSLILGIVYDIHFQVKYKIKHKGEKP